MATVPRHIFWKFFVFVWLVLAVPQGSRSCWGPYPQHCHSASTDFCFGSFSIFVRLVLAVLQDSRSCWGPIPQHGHSASTYFLEVILFLSGWYLRYLRVAGHA